MSNTEVNIIGNATTTILGQDVIYTEIECPLDLLYHKCNPRISIKEDVSVEDMEYEIEATSEFHALLRSIDANGGLIDPIVVRASSGGKYEVIEGFRRTFAYRKLRQEKPNLFSHIKAYVFPEDVSDKTIKALLATIHGKLRHSWDAHPQAVYALKFYDDLIKEGQSQEYALDVLGLEKENVKIMQHCVAVNSEFIKATGCKDRWSQWHAAIKAAPNVIMENLKDRNTKKRVFEIMRLNKFKSTHRARELKDFISSPYDLEILEREGLESARKEKKKHSHKPILNTVFNKIEDVLKSCESKKIKIADCLRERVPEIARRDFENLIFLVAEIAVEADMKNVLEMALSKASMPKKTRQRKSRAKFKPSNN